MNFLKSIIFYLGLIACCLSCISENDTVPSRYIQPEKMKKIMYDMYLADELNAMRIEKDIQLDRSLENRQYYQNIFANYGVSREQFLSSLDYYMKHPKLFDVLTDSLNVYSQKMITQGLSDNPQKIKDGNNLKDTARPVRRKFFNR
jgi:hypothetical protein